MRRVVISAVGCGVVSWMLACASTFADDSMLYYIEDGRVVLTNTPSAAARPVPGMDQPATLPAGTTGMIARRGEVRSLPQLSGPPFAREIGRVARETGLAVELIESVAWVESAMNPKAVSKKGAMGLMQLMPATAQAYGVNDPFDPYQNLSGGARHLRDLLEDWDGDLTLALAAYNAGSGAVRRYGGVPAYRETQNYVVKVQRRLGREVDGAARRRPSTSPVQLSRGADGRILLSN